MAEPITQTGDNGQSPLVTSLREHLARWYVKAEQGDIQSTEYPITLEMLQDKYKEVA